MSKFRSLIAGLAMCAAIPFGYAQASEVTVGLVSDVPSLDASKDLSPIGFNLRLNVYDQLTEMRADGSVGPRLATDWETSEDGLVWTFNLRKDALFHDGSPVTADDVVWTYTRLKDDATLPYRPYLTKIDKIEKTGDHQVRITLNSPFAAIVKQLTIMSILPKKTYEEMGPDAFARAPIGSGPYKVVEHVRDDHLTLEAFDKYWNGKPEVTKAIFRPIPAPLGRINALKTGEVDLAVDLPPAMLPMLEKDQDIEIKRNETFRVMYLGFNTAFAALDDENLRHAIDAAIDRETISERLLKGLGKPSGQLMPPITFGYSAEIEPTKYDPEKAKELLAKSNYKGEVIPMQYPNNNYALADEIAQAIVGYLDAVGIKVELRPMEFSTFIPDWSQRKLDAMFYFAYGSSIFDSENITAGLLETGSRIYKPDRELDRLATLARETIDQEKRLQYFVDISKRIRETGIYLPLYVEYTAFGQRNGVNWPAMPDGFIRLYDFKEMAKN